ncbi:MAG: hypothetical protein K0Q55_3572 [Verrucomicrobia bacterium]|nr:hypothetical protein [Verrucomicrobiota bacterium]
MKYGTHGEYDSDYVSAAERAFITVWCALGSWHNDLVLVGGLVPRYICGDLSDARELPRPVTLDTDLGIALGADMGQYGSVKMDLQAQGFTLKAESGGPRFVRAIGNLSVPVDFLVESRPATHGAVTVADVRADIMPGIDRALASARQLRITGTDLYGAVQKDLKIRVCEAGPFLALKLRAFARRQAPKDAFDILYTLRHYDDGTDAAVSAFGEEVRAGNPACADAVTCLNQHFQNEQSSAPLRAATFILGPATAT